MPDWLEESWQQLLRGMTAMLPADRPTRARGRRRRVAPSPPSAIQQTRTSRRPPWPLPQHRYRRPSCRWPPRSQPVRCGRARPRRWHRGGEPAVIDDRAVPARRWSRHRIAHHPGAVRARPSLASGSGPSTPSAVHHPRRIGGAGRRIPHRRSVWARSPHRVAGSRAVAPVEEQVTEPDVEQVPVRRDARARR